MGGVPRTEPMATWSLVCGIAGFVICGVVLGVAAIVLANNAQRKIAASNGTLTGYGLARAGRILGIIAAVVGIAVLAIFVNQR
jgi:NhaP-type Na+/H+ or K+/H+ antiporter